MHAGDILTVSDPIVLKLEAMGAVVVGQTNVRRVKPRVNQRIKSGNPHP